MDKNHQQTSSINLTWDHINPTIHHHHHQIPQFPAGFSIMSSSSSSDYPPISILSTNKQPGFEKLGSNNITRYDDIFPSGGESTMVGLRLGRVQKEYGDGYFPLSITKTLKSTAPISSTKRSRASYHNTNSPCCQVEGCNLDLKSAKDYHGRHRICETHSKSPKVVVAGIECRFCQQCSRFHGLSEFDDNKRSCRRRLSEHNARRRKVQPAESTQLNSPRKSSASLYDQRPQNINAALSRLPAVPFSNSRWENNIASTSISRDVNALFKPSKSRFSSDIAIHSSISNLNMDSESSLPSGFLDHQCLHVSATDHSTKVPDLVNSAHSLLSFKSWSFNEGETESTSSMEGLVHNPPAIMRYTESGISNDLSLFRTSSNNIQAEQDQTPPALSMVYSHNDQQEQHISYGFYSTQRNL